ncbi:MAG: hypothetical protein IKV14_07125 [Muribaculaceae bacterium]|nr:hypothetical protein [Muribaculaceae bacterium]
MKQLKHYSYLMALMFILAGGIISCAGEEDGSKDTGLTTEPTTCRVSVSSGEGGTATTSETEVMPGWEVILTATPETTYRFVNWTVSGNEVSKENPYRAIVKTSTQFRANFEKDNYKVSVKEAEGGSVKASQKGDVLNGTKVTFTATPQEGFSFISWIVNGNEASKENPYTITITENTEVQASFITHKVTVTASEGGTAKASKTQVGHNAQVTFTATPQDDYYLFVNWTVNGEEVSKETTYTATITEDIEIKANFALNISLPTGIENGKGYVDLGLSVKWASCNVGANSHEEYGYNFSWGEFQNREDFSYYNEYVSLDVFGDFSYDIWKYNTDSKYGTVDNKTTLELKDDAAHHNWGGNWRMPTKAEQDELRNSSNCTWTWTTQNGVKGYKVTSKKNGNSIFLPAAGYRSNSDLSNAGCNGYYWSSSLNTSDSLSAYYLSFNSGIVDWSYRYRCEGLSVRAVCP